MQGIKIIIWALLLASPTALDSVLLFQIFSGRPESHIQLCKLVLIRLSRLLILLLYMLNDFSFDFSFQLHLHMFNIIRYI